MVLQTLYNLADEQVVYQIRDRLSFMRFLGLGLEDTVPDATTVWLFREALAEAGLVKTLFERFNGYLEAKGYIARGGQIVDPPSSTRPSSTTPVRRTRRSKRARRPRVGMRSRPRMRRKIRTHAGRRRTRKASTATRTTSASTASTRSFGAMRRPTPLFTPPLH